MKIYIANDKGSLIFSDIIKDFIKYTRHKVVFDAKSADVIWLLNFWDIKNHNIDGKICCQLHHVDMDMERQYPFDLLKKCKNIIVPNNITYEILKNKGISATKLPYWLVSSKMVSFDIQEINKMKKDLGDGSLLVGSFQKDGNGKSGDVPKNSKNPQLFIDIVKEIKNVKVVLTGYARNYVINELKKNNIPFVYFEKCSNEELIKLYKILDLYLVTSRYEGGPQAILECAYHKVPILSTNVGMASDVLSKYNMCQIKEDFLLKIENLQNTDQDALEISNNFVNSLKFTPNQIVSLYDEYFSKII